MFRQLTLGALALLAALHVHAQNIQLTPDYPDVYVVTPGDTLWDISALFLQDPWLWPEIWQINEQVENPHFIYPGDRLRLVFVDGQPRLVTDAMPTSDRVVRLTPQMTSMPVDEAITAIPLDQIREFFSQARVLSEEEIESAPYMVAGPESRIMIGQGDRMYSRGVLTPGVNLYQVYRVGERYRDPETREWLGTRAELMGTARLESVSGEVGSLTLTSSASEIIPGDLLFPIQQQDMDAVFFPRVPSSTINGEIIAVEGGVNYIGQLDVVAINRGLEHDISNGLVLQVLDRGEQVRDRVEGGRVQLPDERAGVLIVFRTLPKMSFGLVLEAEKPLAVGSPITNP